MVHRHDADPGVLGCADLAGSQAPYVRRYTAQALGLPVVARGPCLAHGMAGRIWEAGTPPRSGWSPDRGAGPLRMSGAVEVGEAVAAAREWQPDLVLLDVQMPEVDGTEVSKRLRSQRATAYIPIVGMTAVPAQARRAGMLADDWLPKPFDLDDLYRAVARWT